jgi:hypothetical protein
MINEQGQFVWKPHFKQEKFLQIPLSVKEGFYAGAVNAGKTDVLLMYPIVWGWHKHPEFKGVFLRRTMPELEMEVIPRADQYFRPLGATWNGQKGLWTFPSGALIFMKHCEHEKNVHMFDSMQINYLAFDELTSFTEWMYLYLTIERVRVPERLEGVLPAIVRSGSNPGNIGHQFVYKRFIKPNPSGYKILRGRGGIKRIFIPATIDDNPYASKKYKAELDALPEAERRAKKGGDWQAYEGQVFSELRDKHINGEPENALHVIKPFEIPSYWPRIVAIDWGFNAMCSIGWGAVSPNKRVYVYRHQMFTQKKIEEWAPEVKYYVEKEKPETIIICHSANQHRGDPHTIQEQVREALDWPVVLGEKDRLAGKILLHEYLRWEPKPEIPRDELEPYSAERAQWIMRNDGVREYNNYIRQYLEHEEETNIPKILFFDTEQVKVIVDTIKACVYAKSDMDGKKKEDVAEFSGDDPYDMLRMLLHKVDLFFALAEVELKKLEEVSTVVNQYQATQDATAYYRNMRTLEAKQQTSLGVARYHNHARRFRVH